MRGLALILLLGLVISVTCEPRDEATDQSQDQPDLKAELIEDQAENDPGLETEVAEDEEEEPENAELAGKDDDNDDEDSELADVQGGQLKESDAKEGGRAADPIFGRRRRYYYRRRRRRRRRFFGRK
ncbi:predicted protein [Nematostella vectensis]|uniref:Uncharacterized protein n=1 Tax=Nematostella vectensis TaxID=45351 RepID=A7RXS9_NEMVE|nr:predicted protein [Nematostella vectensis]|eukprot:XP_001635778.1 predicted protein [Nematostella vectensis]